MLDAAVLPAWLAACAETLPGQRCVVVAGGGRLVDEIRRAQALWDFDDRLAHRLAIDAMAINARMLRALAPRLAAFSRPSADDLPAGPALWVPQAPYDWLALPESWAATSDSIALRLAEHIGADAAVLVKSVEPAALTPRSAAALAADGIIDACLPSLLGGGVGVRLIARGAHAAFRAGRAAGTLPGTAVEG